MAPRPGAPLPLGEDRVRCAIPVWPPRRLAAAARNCAPSRPVPAPSGRGAYSSGGNTVITSAMVVIPRATCAAADRRSGRRPSASAASA